MRRWWRENAEDREQHERPDPEAYGLDETAIRPLFADYVSRMTRSTEREGQR
jgi:hypothetical protein